MRKSLPSTIAITGASTGLGAALALEFAGPDRKLLLCARRSDLLSKVAETCRIRGADVETAIVDVRSQRQISDWLTQSDERQPIDLLIANAGMFGGHGVDGKMETAEEVSDILDTNLKGAICAASTLAERMRARRRGHIALISSLASFYPQADAPTYSASKAGLTAYGEALREFLAPDGVTVSLVHPGNIESVQTDVQRGRKPMMMSAETAAAQIKKGIDRRRSNINFPVLLHILVLLNRFLPWRLRALTNLSFRFHVVQQDPSEK